MPGNAETTCIATLVGLHGLKGALKARLEVSSEALPAKLAPLWLVDTNGRAYPATLRKWEFTQPGEALVQLHGYDDRTAATLLRGCTLHLPTSSLAQAPVPAPGEELVGLTLHDVTSGVVGTIETVEDRPGQPLLHVRCTLPDHSGKTILVPLHPDLVEALDPEAGTLTLDLPNGLLALYLDEA